IATKVGHRLKPDQSIYTDYSKQYIIEACEDSLKRLRRESIDYYQLHTARLNVLREGDCIEAMHELQESGKIRYWGLSLNTFSPEPEADYLIEHQLGHGIQLVLNVLNQRAIGIIRKTSAEGYGIIARMPLQFGLLTGKFDMHTRFSEDDHRSFRLTSSILEKSIPALQKIWPLAEKYDISKTALSLSFILNFDEVSTVIPGMKNSEQVISNTSQITTLTVEDMQYLTAEFERSFHLIVDEMQLAG
ncbi:MAG: aldo/keto reductase, partial [Saprospiraceae bacterium]|nr:aldo/keto reductase [Saprospiraceae bacterium]